MWCWTLGVWWADVLRASGYAVSPTQASDGSKGQGRAWLIPGTQALHWVILQKNLSEMGSRRMRRAKLMGTAQQWLSGLPTAAGAEDPSRRTRHPHGNVQCPLYSSGRKVVVFFFFSVVRAIWCISEICFRLRWIMSLIINYIAHFKASPLPRYQVRCGKSLPSGPTILLFRNSLHIHWFPFSDTRLLPHFCLSWDFVYKSLYAMALELIFKQFWYIYFLIYKHHRGLCIPRKLLQGIAYKE